MAVSPPKVGYRAYLRQQIEAATPLRRVLMLYDGAIRFIAVGRRCIEEKNYEKQNESIQRAQAIIFELISSLNQEIGGEIAGNLLAIYTYMLRRLIEANIKDDLTKLDEVTRMLTELRTTWAELEQGMDVAIVEGADEHES